MARIVDQPCGHPLTKSLAILRREWDEAINFEATLLHLEARKMAEALGFFKGRNYYRLSESMILFWITSGSNRSDPSVVARISIP